MHSFNLKGKTIIVTGGTGVLGEVFVQSIASAGGTVGILGRNENVANERAKKIVANGGTAIPLIADVTDEKQLTEACTKILSVTGKIDGLVNAAGGNLPEAVVQPSADLFNLNIDAFKKGSGAEFIRHSFTNAGFWKRNFKIRQWKHCQHIIYGIATGINKSARLQPCQICNRCIYPLVRRRIGKSI